MLSPQNITKRSPRLSIPLELGMTSSPDIISPDEDNSQNDDYKSMKTNDTSNEPSISSMLQELRFHNSQDRQKRAVLNLCRNIKEKECVITKLNLQIKILRQQNKILKELTPSHQNPVIQKDIISECVDSNSKLKYFELLIEQKNQQIIEIKAKHQQQINLFYSNSNTRLKDKQIECYNTSKTLKQQIIKCKHFEDKCKYLTSQNTKLQQSISYFYKQKQKLIDERDIMSQQIKKGQINISRLKYCESQSKYLNQQYFKQKDNIIKLNQQINFIRQQNINLSRQLQIIRIRNEQSYRLGQKVACLEDQIKEIHKNNWIKSQKLVNKLKIYEKMIDEQNNQTIGKDLRRINQSMKGRIF